MRQAALIVSLALCCRPLWSQVVVVPNDSSNREGNLSNSDPFHLAAQVANEKRYQQVYSASDFSVLSAPRDLVQVFFRPNATNLDGGVGNAFSSTLSDIEISFSTTAAAPDALSSTFDLNKGVDETIVKIGALPLSSAFTGPANGPKDFDIKIDFSTRFSYDRTVGNLLLEVRNRSPEGTTFFDSEYISGDAVSRASAAGAGSAMADYTDTLGLVTRFVFVDPNCILPPVDVDLILADVMSTELVEACSSITAGSNYNILAPGDVTFRAGNFVVLNNGFSVGYSAVFRVIIQPPTN